jgi:membrane-associated phospholipid phosphatase
VTTAEVPEADRRRRVRGLLATAVLCTVLLGVVYGLAVRTTEGQRLDSDALTGRNRERPTVVEATGQLLDTISVQSLAVVGIGICLIALVRGRPHLAVGAAILLLGSNTTTQVLKKVVLTRPDLARESGLALNTFPSGHTTVAMSIALALVVVVPSRWRGVAAAVGGAYAIAVGVAVLTTGWHRPSDALGAYLVVTAWACAVLAVLVAGWGRVRAAAERARVFVGPAFGIAGAVILVGAFAVLVVIEIAERGQLATVGIGATYVVAAAAIAGTGLLCVGVVVVLLRGITLEGTPLTGPAPRATLGARS